MRVCMCARACVYAYVCLQCIKCYRLPCLYWLMPINCALDTRNGNIVYQYFPQRENEAYDYEIA